MRKPFLIFQNSKGINNIEDPLDLKPNERQKCLDIDIDRNGGECRRKNGITQVVLGDYQQIWSNNKVILGIYENDLVKLAPNMLSHEIIHSNVGLNFMWFEDCAHSGIIYYTNGDIIGCIRHNVIKSIPTTTVPDRIDLIPGHMLMYFALRLWIAVGDKIYYTDPDPGFNFNRINLQANFIQRKGYITLMKPVEDGFYVADGSTWFIPGTNPQVHPHPPVQFICDYDAIPGAVTQYPIDIEVIEDGGNQVSGKGICWAATKGIRYGLKGGISGNYTRKRLRMPTNPVRGTCLHRNEDNTFNQLITVIHN